MTSLPPEELGRLTASTNMAVELIDVRLQALEAHRSNFTHRGTLTVEVVLETKGRQGEDVLETRSRYIAAARPVDNSDESDDEAWVVVAEFTATFEKAPDAQLSEDQVSVYSMTTGAMAIHPYARQLIQETTARLGYPPFTMELLRSPALHAWQDHISRVDVEDQRTSDEERISQDEAHV